MAAAPYTLYSPAIPRETNELVPAKELKQKLTDFYTLYKPENTRGEQMENYLKYARSKGVLALKTVLKQKYKCSLDEADCSEIGWNRLFRKLEEFYKKHAGDREVQIYRIFMFAREKGLLALDTELRGKYGESLSEFMASGLTLWKRNWREVLQKHHADAVTYELNRFYTFVGTLPQQFQMGQDMHTLVNWATQHTRTEVNEKLLKKYRFCLDDVKMVKGTTNEERKINLKAQLIEFYQRNDPERLGSDVYGSLGGFSNAQHISSASLDTLESSVSGRVSRAMAAAKISANSSIRSSVESKDKISPEMLEIERRVEWGIIHLDELEKELTEKYGKGLEDSSTKELRRRLTVFYRQVNSSKNPDSIEKIIEYAKKKGLQAMNEKLVLTYGKGIVIDDLV